MKTKTMKMRKAKPKPRPSRAKPEQRAGVRVIHFEEPMLEFGYRQRLTYPRDGLFLFGPVDSSERLGSTRFGIVGTPEGIRCFEDWSRRMTGYIAVPELGPQSRAVEPQHVPFPGYAEAFRSNWALEPSAIVSDLDPFEIDRVIHMGVATKPFMNTVCMYVSRLVGENNRLENPPSFFANLGFWPTEFVGDFRNDSLPGAWDQRRYVLQLEGEVSAWM